MECVPNNGIFEYPERKRDWKPKLSLTKVIGVRGSQNSRCSTGALESRSHWLAEPRVYYAAPYIM
jgi:hypothetical protein